MTTPLRPWTAPEITAWNRLPMHAVPHRDDDLRLYLREELYQVLHKAFDGSGIPWADCFCEDRGDGALIVVPPAVPCKGLIDPLPERLRGLIRRHINVFVNGDLSGEETAVAGEDRIDVLPAISGGT